MIELKLFIKKLRQMTLKIAIKSDKCCKLKNKKAHNHLILKAFFSFLI